MKEIKDYWLCIQAIFVEDTTDGFPLACVKELGDGLIFCTLSNISCYEIEMIIKILMPLHPLDTKVFNLPRLIFQE